MFDDHDLEVQIDEPDDMLAAVCSCGWVKEGLASIEQAHDAWENHCDVVFMDATAGVAEQADQP